MPGITSVFGADLMDNCVVMLHRNGHTSPTSISIDGMEKENMDILWKDTFNEQMDRCYADHQDNTEMAAIGISVLLAKQITGYTIISRSRKGTGFDYTLGDCNDELYIPKARLEISGIEKESLVNTINNRFRQKEHQVTPTDKTGLPAYISIVEFSAPKALFNKKAL
jgi:hypothetical protein